MEQSMGNPLDDREFFEDVIRAMSQVPILSRLTVEQLDDLARLGQLRYFEPRERVFLQNTRGEDLHVVLDGKVHLVRNEGGIIRLVSTREAGSSFGEISFLTGETRSLSALAGPDGALDLVLERKDFESFIERQPRVGYRIYKELLETVRDRMSTLPPFYRNYLMWGYRPDLQNPEDVKSPPAQVSKVFMLSVGGAFGAVLGSLFLRTLLPLVHAEFAARILASGPASVVAMALGGALAGALIGDVFQGLDDRVKRGQRHARSCGNCKFAVWDEDTGAIDCVYRRENLMQAAVRPGKAHDRYTDCPSFDLLLPEEKIRKMSRDTMGRD